MSSRTTHQTDAVAAIIPAAGAGLRMGGEPKQFRSLGDAPVLVQTLRAIGRAEAIKSVVVAVPVGEVSAVGELVREFGLNVSVVAGGSTRQDSVAEGLNAIGDTSEIVLVHDAVRPFISAGDIREVIAAVRQHGAAAVAVPVADTLRRGKDGRFGETVDREGVFRMLTPQGARVGLLAEAQKEAALGGFVATDEVELLQRVGVKVHLVIGDERNIKLTRPSDWELAEALWPEWQRTENGS